MARVLLTEMVLLQISQYLAMMNGNDSNAVGVQKQCIGVAGAYFEFWCWAGFIGHWAGFDWPLGWFCHTDLAGFIWLKGAKFEVNIERWLFQCVSSQFTGVIGDLLGLDNL